ncbi:uncharacterized protein LOC111288580 [Durio zibethinus]|uniref:Uncharacterized protein LOC111288580 n=1 Tax=Durio zibethinus TaxID=66656 RepID=A0A6P5Y5H4_DURZI|nr:uncharacterized protein LOC111288580 [Durio zibethinus]
MGGSSCCWGRRERDWKMSFYIVFLPFQRCEYSLCMKRGFGGRVDARPNLWPNVVAEHFTSRPRTEELRERSWKLKEIAEREEYQKLVKVIALKKDFNEPFSTYKDQLGFGLHVALTMFAGYLVGYFAFKALFNHSPIMNAAGDILGLVFGMLLETLLFVIRSSDPGLKSPSSTSRLKKNQ